MKEPCKDRGGWWICEGDKDVKSMWRTGFGCIGWIHDAKNCEGRDMFVAPDVLRSNHYYLRSSADTNYKSKVMLHAHTYTTHIDARSTLKRHVKARRQFSHMVCCLVEHACAHHHTMCGSTHHHTMCGSTKSRARDACCLSTLSPRSYLAELRWSASDILSTCGLLIRRLGCVLCRCGENQTPWR